MLGQIRKLWSLFSAAERHKATWLLGAMILMAAIDTAGVISIVPFLSVLSRPGIIHENALFSRAYNWLGSKDERAFMFALGTASIAIVISGSAFKVVAQHQITRFVHLQRHHLSSRLLAVYLSQPYEYFLSHNSADLSKNVLSEIDLLIGNVVQPLAQFITQSTIVLAMFMLIVTYDPQIAFLLTCVLALLYGAIYFSARKRLTRIGDERVHANRSRHKMCREALEGIKDVKVTHSDRAYLGAFNNASRLHARHMAASETLSQSPLYLVEAVGYTGLIAIALILLAKTNDIAHVMPALGLYGFATYRILPAVQIIYRGAAKLRFASKSLGQIYRDLTLPRQMQNFSRTEQFVPQKEIRLDNIRYAYPSTDGGPLFDRFNLKIPANTSLGISGKSGSGKSTLMDLVLGLLSPQKGTLTVDKTPINSNNIHKWHNSIGYVPQHIFLSDASVEENIAFGVPKDKIDKKRVIEAAISAQLHQFVIDSLPSGYETSIGDRGIRLSGGQRQRIGIARALYRDPPILLLDEATSALDPQTEEAITEAVKSLSGKKTIVVIAHRERSLSACEHIIRIDGPSPLAPC